MWWQEGVGVRVGVRFTRRLWALAGWELSQECFAPQAASPRTAGELRMPFSAEQTPLGWGSLFGDGTARNGEDQAAAPHPHCRVHLPQASRLVGGFSPAVWVRRAAQDSDWGRGQHPVVGEGRVLQAWVGEGDGSAY